MIHKTLEYIGMAYLFVSAILVFYVGLVVFANALHRRRIRHLERMDGPFWRKI